MITEEELNKQERDRRFTIALAKVDIARDRYKQFLSSLISLTEKI